MEHPIKRIIALFGIVVVSGLAGMVGGLFGQSAYQAQLSRLTPPSLLETSTTRLAAEKIPAEILEEVGASIFSIFVSEKSVAKKGKVAETQIRFVGYGVAVTTDGWMVAPTSIVGAVEGMQILDRDRVQYRIARRIDDTAIPLSYLKLESARVVSLKPISFPALLQKTLPLTGYRIHDYQTITPFTLTGLGYLPAASGIATVQAPGVLAKRFNYSEQFSIAGQPIITTKQEVVGLTSAQGIVPIASVREGLDQVLRAGEVRRPSLPLSYVDNAWTLLPSIDPKVQSSRVGALVTGTAPINLKGQTTTPVVLMPNDVILAVNDERIDQQRSLSEIIQQYKVGDIVTLGVQRGDKTQNFMVALQ